MEYVFKNKFYTIFFTIFDFIGSVLFFPAKLIFRSKLPKDPKNILIIRLDHIGDVVYSAPVAVNLKLAYPDARITFLVSTPAKDIIANNPYIDEIICFDAPWFSREKKTNGNSALFWGLVKKVRKINFDIGLDLRGDFRQIVLMWLSGIRFRVSYGITGGGFLLNKQTHYHKRFNPLERNLHHLESLNIPIVINRTELFSSKDDVAFVEGFLSENNIKPEYSVIIHPCAGYSSKNWSSEKFSELARLIRERLNLSLIFIGAQKDVKTINSIIEASGIDAINAAGKTSLGELVALIQKTGFFIGVDSGPSHVASILNKPAIILYSGTNNANEWAPRGINTVVIQKKVSCQECELLECKINECMNLITVKEVFDTLNVLVAKNINKE
ncbi:MAG: glycosyltransferase family 9 protein [Candidatus Omnitrophica bacterium]|nr:glycosyltransferase family 9 protein [Candidatus Omnitrophota bacterium]